MPLFTPPRWFTHVEGFQRLQRLHAKAFSRQRSPPRRSIPPVRPLPLHPALAPNPHPSLSPYLSEGCGFTLRCTRTWCMRPVRMSARHKLIPKGGGEEQQREDTHKAVETQRSRGVSRGRTREKYTSPGRLHQKLPAGLIGREPRGQVASVTVLCESSSAYYCAPSTSPQRVRGKKTTELDFLG